MAKVVFHQAFDFAHIDFSQFTDGSVTNFTSSEIDVVDGDYSAQVLGSGFDFAGDGTVNEIIGAYQGNEVFDISGLNVALAQLNADRMNETAIINDIFGGNDQFKGSNGADGLYGFGGNDKISGGKGADTIVGGAGHDQLTGGAGADTFQYLKVSDSGKTAAKADLITDLDDANDHIDLTALHVTGNITAAYSAETGLTTFSIDVNGDHKVDMIITATGDHHAFDGFIT